MTLKPLGYALSLMLTLVLFLAACGGKDRVKNENEAKPGRDRELYGTAEQKLKKGRYDEARLLYNVVITTYPDSEYLSLAKLSIADSFYLEGGSSNLEQAVSGYKDFAQYFPTHPLACNVKLKIAHAHMRQMNAFNRDWTKARAADFQLQAALQSCQSSPLKADIEENLRQVQQVEGLHELDIARFYMQNRQAYKAAEGRLRDIVVKYPHFTYRDESLYRLGVALIEQEQPEEAAQYFTELVREVPGSEYVKQAKDYLEKLGKPIPEPAKADAAPPRPGMMGRAKLILGWNDLTVSEDGVLVKKEGKIKEEAAEAMQKPVEAVGGINAVRASTKGGTSVPQTQGAANAVAPTTLPANGANGNGNGAPEAKAAAPKENAKDPKKDEKKDAKKKKGILGGIFK